MREATVLPPAANGGYLSCTLKFTCTQTTATLSREDRLPLHALMNTGLLRNVGVFSPTKHGESSTWLVPGAPETSTFPAVRLCATIHIYFKYFYFKKELIMHTLCFAYSVVPVHRVLLLAMSHVMRHTATATATAPAPATATATAIRRG